MGKRPQTQERVVDSILQELEVLKASGPGCDKAEGHIYGWKGNSRFRNTMEIRLIISETQVNLSFLLKDRSSIKAVSKEKTKL